MTSIINLQAFEIAAGCKSLDEIKNLIKRNPGQLKIHLQAAAFGMVLVASQAVGKTIFFQDVENLLEQLAQAKAEIDIVACHNPNVVKATLGIFLAAQQYVDETTFPCTDWATPSEVANVVLEISKSYVALV